VANTIQMPHWKKVLCVELVDNSDSVFNALGLVELNVVNWCTVLTIADSTYTI